MIGSVDQARFEALVVRIGLNDRALGTVIGVGQSTVWRMRQGKIYKLSNYIAKMESHLGISADSDRSDDDVLVTDLMLLARHSPELKQALIALRDIMHKKA